MRIGIDAKRIFLNKSGLGSYGRNLVTGLNSIIDDDNKYFLYTPKKTNLFDYKNLNFNFTTKESESFSKALWRTITISHDLKNDGIDIYHGISNEFPLYLSNKKINTIVDIHDLLFLRFPQFYSFFDRQIFRIKTEMACRDSDKIIATSIATKNEIIKYYNTNPNKIEVVYQSCNDSFFNIKTKEEKLAVLEKYSLPKEYILCVGTIQERKNQKQILEALKISKNKIPLVLVGGGKKYKTELIEFAFKNKLQLVFPNKFVKDEDLPAIYQHAKIFVFPGLYEGFGIPVLEAMASKTNVITSINTSMSEIVKNTKCLINPLSTEDIADRIDYFLENDSIDIVEDNFLRAKQFTNIKFAERTLKVYDAVRNK